MKKQIQIRIFPDGTISSETINIKGSTYFIVEDEQ